MSHKFSMGGIGFVFVLCMSTSLRADEVIVPGGYHAFVTPHPPYISENVKFSIELGYGTPETTIGSATWFTEAGFFDLSSDPNLHAFLGFAMNGVGDGLTVKLTDGQGYQVTYQSFGEGGIFGTSPSIDLAGLPVTGMQLEVLDARAPAGGIVVRWQTLGTPEPATIVFCVLSIGFLSRRKTSRTIW